MGKEKVGCSVGEQVVVESMTRNHSSYRLLHHFPWHVLIKKLSYHHRKGMICGASPGYD